MIRMIQKNMNKKGFTLVELIIVIAVMAILAAIIVPRMAGITSTFKENADERVTASYAREIELLVQTGKLDLDTVANLSGTVASVDTVDVDKAPQSLATAAANTYYYVLELTSATPNVYTLFVYASTAVDNTTILAASSAAATVTAADTADVPYTMVIKVQKIQ